MNKELENKVVEINSLLKSDELIKKYNSLSKEIVENSNLLDLETKLTNLNKMLCKELDESISISKQEVIIEFNKTKEILTNSILYQEYNTYKEEVDSLIKQINELLSNI